MNKYFTQHAGKVIDTNLQFTHVMALALDSRTDYHTGVLRCITSRIGDVGVKGYVDRSELHLVAGNSLESFQIGQKLDIKNEAEIIHQLSQNSLEFIGLEDPDIWIDTNSNLLHLYFTLPFINVATDKYCVHLGHAVGRDLNSLEMTLPSLMADDKISAKELSIAPLNRQGFRFNQATKSTMSPILLSEWLLSKIWQNLGLMAISFSILANPKFPGLAAMLRPVHFSLKILSMSARVNALV